MNSLMNYGSDDDYEDSGDEKNTDTLVGNTKKSSWKRGNSSGGGGSQDNVDANYDEVQMDLSEDSNDSKSGKDSSRLSKDRDDGRKRYDRERYSPKQRDDYRRRDRKEESDRHASYRKDKSEERSKYRDDRSERRSREEDRSDRHSRDDDRGGKDRHRDEDDRSRSDRSRDDRHSRDKRERKRSRSREYVRSRSPRKERSRSKERTTNRGNFNKRYDRTNNKMDRLDKMGIEIKTPDCQFVKPSELQKSMNDEKNSDTNKDRFFMPGITGRFRDQIERRKLLWQKKEPETPKPVIAAPSIVPGSSRTTKVWEATTFAQDTDGKVASKFKRLMGIKNPGEGANTAVDVLKKQEEMFSSMEQQYEVARTATHTMRGVGLGFGSFQR